MLVGLMRMIAIQEETIVRANPAARVRSGPNLSLNRPPNKIPSIDPNPEKKISLPIKAGDADVYVFRNSAPNCVINAPE